MVLSQRKRGRPQKGDAAERISFHLRLRPELHEQLRAVAECERRLLGDEIEYRLERSLKEDNRTDHDNRIDAVADQIGGLVKQYLGYLTTPTAQRAAALAARVSHWSRVLGTHDNTIWQRAAAIVARELQSHAPKAARAELTQNSVVLDAIPLARRQEKLTALIYRLIAERVAEGTDDPAKDGDINIAFLGDEGRRPAINFPRADSPEIDIEGSLSAPVPVSRDAMWQRAAGIAEQVLRDRIKPGRAQPERLTELIYRVIEQRVAAGQALDDPAMDRIVDDIMRQVLLEHSKETTANEQRQRSA